MRELNRRQFFASAALPGLLSAAGKLQAATPAMAIAHYKAPPTAPDGIAEEARRLTRRAVEALGGMRRFVTKGNVVWVKPNIGWDRRPEQAACTNPDVVAAIVEMCFQAGAKKVMVSDHPCNSPQRTFPRSGIQAAAEKAGAECFFMDDRKFRKMAIKGGKVIKEWEVYTEVVEADLLINVPIVKCHDLSKATLGMKNLLGVTAGPRDRFHQNIAGTAADLAGFIRPRLVVMDAVRILTANGPVGGNLADVKRKDIVVASVDQVAIDAYGAALLGLKPSDVGFVAEAHARGLGNMNFQALSPLALEV